MISLCFNNTLVERDMDMLFLESAMTYPGFCQLLIEKTDLKGKPFKVVAGELSKSDELGESDITVIVEVEGQKYGMLGQKIIYLMTETAVSSFFYIFLTRTGVNLHELHYEIIMIWYTISHNHKTQ